MPLLRRKQHDEIDKDDLLAQLSKRVPLPLLESLAATGELPGPARSVTAPEMQGRVLHMLGRFLAAEKYDVDKAMARLQAHAEWRQETIPKGGIPDADVEVHLQAKKSVLQPPGAKGQPLAIVLARNHKPCGYDSIKRYIIYCLEAAAALADEAVAAQGASGKYNTLIDLKGLQLKNLDAQALRACFQLLQAHFPERLGTCYMLEAPTIFAGLWAVVRPFLDPVTQQKVKFVDGKAARDVLCRELGADVLPKEYGGEAEPVPIEQAVQQVRELRQAAAAQQLEAEAQAAAAAAHAQGQPQRKHHHLQHPEEKLHKTQHSEQKAVHGHKEHGKAAHQHHSNGKQQVAGEGMEVDRS